MLPFFYNFISFEYVILFFLCLIGFAVYTTIIRGVVRKSKYGIIGALRASRQRISYEIAFSLYVLTVLVHNKFFRFIRQYLIVLFII